jgi:pimeloyl-ACP methyl ester carboxylesterase
MTPSLRRIALSTGVELDVMAGGAGEPLMFLHGFPESHRTWRHQLAAFAPDHLVVAPDQRGYARSSKPEGVEAYAADRIVADMIALADALGLDRFTVVAHDWGGACAWAAALKHPDRIARLVIANAPHPLLFQRALFNDPAQRVASQYMTAFRNPAFEDHIAKIGVDGFLDKMFAAYIASGAIDADERALYLDQWRQPGALTAMLYWYRASRIIVPAPGEAPERPGWIDQPFPPVTVPTLVIWGMCDQALLPGQLDGLDALVNDLTVAKIDGAGHFVPWEAPAAVTDAIRAFLAARPID